MKIKNNNYIRMLLIIVLIAGFMRQIFAEPTEELLIINGLGCDVEKKSRFGVEFLSPVSYYNFKNNQLSSCDVKTGKGLNFSVAREDLQSKVSRRFILGFERVFLFSEKASQIEIRSALETQFVNANANDNASVAIVSDSVENAFKVPTLDETCASDEIYELIKSLSDNNFYSEHYTLMDAYSQTNREGESLVLPYIEHIEKGFQAKGLALFKNYKMIGRLNIDETKYFNLLRENKVRGLINIQRSPSEYLSFYGTSKKKIKCEKSGEAYNFLIDVSVTGELQGNTAYENLYTNTSLKKDIEDELASKIAANSKSIIGKLQHQYHFDGLKLGSFAASKYGRHRGVNWDEVISNSEIDVNVKVHLERTGRGSFAS